MAVSDGERSAFQKEWVRDSFSLPDDMQPAQLPPDRILTVPELPTVSRTVNDSTARMAPNPSACLENPIVNPTYGGAPGHRTAAEVRRETATFRDECREEASTHPAVFQPDYLLIQLPGVPLALHSVCIHALLDQATAEEMSSTGSIACTSGQLATKSR